MTADKTRDRIRMNRQEDAVRPYIVGDYSFLFDGVTCVVCVGGETDDAESEVVEFADGFDGNHTDPSYAKASDGWRVSKGWLYKA